MSAEASVTVPPACPACGRLSASNDPHCTEKGRGAGFSWFSKCRAMRCKDCGLLYHAQTPVGVTRPDGR